MRPPAPPPILAPAVSKMHDVEYLSLPGIKDFIDSQIGNIITVLSNPLTLLYRSFFQQAVVWGE